MNDEELAAKLRKAYYRTMKTPGGNPWPTTEWDVVVEPLQLFWIEVAKDAREIFEGNRA